MKPSAWVDAVFNIHTRFLRQLLFRGIKLTEGDRCGQSDCSENIIYSFTR